MLAAINRQLGIAAALVNAKCSLDAQDAVRRIPSFPSLRLCAVFGVVCLAFVAVHDSCVSVYDVCLVDDEIARIA